MVIFAPLDEVDLRNMLYTAQKVDLQHPLAIRYPRGRGFRKEWKLPFEELDFGRGRCLKEGSEIAVLSLGSIGINVVHALEDFSEAEKIAHFDMRFAKPLDGELLHEIFRKFRRIVTLEDGVIKGGFGSAVLEFAQENKYFVPVTVLGIPDEFIDHGKLDELQEIIEIDVKSLKRSFAGLLKNI